MYMPRNRQEQPCVRDEFGTPYITAPDAIARNNRAARTRIARTLVHEKARFAESAGFKYLAGDKNTAAKWVHASGKVVPIVVFHKLNLSALRQRIRDLVGYVEVSQFG